MLKESLTRASPVPIPRVLAVKNWSRPFSITTDRPNMTISVVRMLRSSADWIIVRCTT